MEARFGSKLLGERWSNLLIAIIIRQSSSTLTKNEKWTKDETEKYRSRNII